MMNLAWQRAVDSSDEHKINNKIPKVFTVKVALKSLWEVYNTIITASPIHKNVNFVTFGRLR